jgi:hypothetical protein
MLPFSTPVDPSVEPPGGVDPLGTVSYAERLADLLLPGMTSRMWRPRLLTFSAVASLVADRVAQALGRSELRLEARLTFERLFVYAIVRMEADSAN